MEKFGAPLCCVGPCVCWFVRNVESAKCHVLCFGEVPMLVWLCNAKNFFPVCTEYACILHALFYFKLSSTYGV